MTHQVRFISACFDGEARVLLRDLETKRTREELDTHSTGEVDPFFSEVARTFNSAAFNGEPITIDTHDLYRRISSTYDLSKISPEQAMMRYKDVRRSYSTILTNVRRSGQGKGFESFV